MTRKKPQETQKPRSSDCLSYFDFNILSKNTTMGIGFLLICHFVSTVLVLVIFLCGHWPIFKRTPIRWFHNFITFGAYNYLLRFVGLVCGNRGTNAILSVQNFCCNRPNPILQLLYLAMLGGTYYLVAESSFKYIPGYYLSEIHRFTSLVAVGIGAFFFLVTSFSDPGTVKSENVSQYLSVYPYDNVIYSEKECPTCKISKHFIMCLYGAVAMVLILAGRVKELKVIHVLTVYYGIENSFLSLAPHVVQWLVGAYNTQILLLLFLAIMSLVLGGFFLYQTKLCLTNTTTNETFKWQKNISVQKKLNVARASTAALKSSINVMSSERKPPESKWRTFFRRSPLEDVKVVKKKNTYNKGFLQNLHEIIFPFSRRSLYLQTKSKSG